MLQNTVTAFVAYYRVSTDEQGISGLGLEAQRADVARFIAGRGQLINEYTEIETGKGTKRRPQLEAALLLCRKRKCTLLISTLDRLARRVHFISGLMESGVPFLAADMPNAEAFEIHIRAAMAEEEGRKISKRTKAALAAAKARGVQLGNPRLAEARALARATHISRRPAPEVIRIIENLQSLGRSFRAIADELNRLNIKTGRGCQWYAMTVTRALQQGRAADEKAA